MIDPEGSAPPPADVMADLRAHWIHFEFPAAWKDFDGTLAAFVPGVG